MAEENKEKLNEEDAETTKIDDTETASEDVAEQEDDNTEKTKKFGRKEKKKDPKDILIEELTDRNRRQMAEFDNFRKRTEKEKTAMFEIGAKSIIENILPIVDNFERGFQTLSDEEKTSPFAEGMEKVFRQLTTSLEEAGVKAIEAVGNEFDPNFHNAVMHVDDDSVGDNTVIEEFQKGYTYRDTVVRHSMVKVAN